MLEIVSKRFNSCDGRELPEPRTRSAAAETACSHLLRSNMHCVRGPDTLHPRYTLGRRLFQMVQAACFPAPEITFNQPAVARGENKRFLELSVAEAGPALVEAGLITAEELESTLVEMRRLSADEAVLAVMPRIAQVSARKPA
jgi:hypothetical protein